jgi:hypothetical protein
MQKEVERLEAQKRKWKAAVHLSSGEDSDAEPVDKGEEVVQVQGAVLATGPGRWVDLRAEVRLSFSPVMCSI